MRFDAEDEALHFALALGASVEVLEPEALRARVLATAESLVRRYGVGRSLRRLDLRYQRERAPFRVEEERHPLLRAVRVPVDHVRSTFELDAARESSACFAAISETRK